MYLPLAIFLIVIATIAGYAIGFKEGKEFNNPKIT